MAELIKCPACNRHLRASEPACPFCTAEIPEEARVATSASVTRGTSRAKRYAARAALIAGTAAAIGCGGADKKKDTTTEKEKENYPPPPTPYGCVWPDEEVDV